jgi:hypothetical protein
MAERAVMVEFWELEAMEVDSLARAATAATAERDPVEPVTAALRTMANSVVAVATAASETL